MRDAIAHLPRADHADLLDYCRHNVIHRNGALSTAPAYPPSREIRFDQNPASKPRLDRFEGVPHAKENASKSNTSRSLYLRPVFLRVLLAELAEFGRQLRNRLVEVSVQAVIGNLEDWRVL